MNLTIKEAMELDYVKNLNQITSNQGVDNVITAVGILDHEIIEDNYKLFLEGEFLITSFSVIRDDQEEVFEVIKKLIDRKISGLAIKSVYYRTLAPKTIAYANKHHFPIFVFETIFIEDIINSINSVVYTNSIHDLYEAKIEAIISGKTNPFVFAQYINEIHTQAGEKHYVYYLEQKSFNPEKLIAISNRYRKYRKSFKNTTVLKFREGLLIIVGGNLSYEDIIKDLEVKKQDYYVGRSNNKQQLKQLGDAINEAVTASKNTQLLNASISEFDQLGLNKILIPISKNESVINFYQALLNPIVEYDEKYNTELMATLTTFYSYDGHTKQTALALHQHPNTILYRVKKAKEVLGLKVSDFELNQMLNIAINLRQINKILK
jgi:hypothetical protein